jgi:hypothetical protein
VSRAEPDDLRASRDAIDTSACRAESAIRRNGKFFSRNAAVCAWL